MYGCCTSGGVITRVSVRMLHGLLHDCYYRCLFVLKSIVHNIVFFCLRYLRLVVVVKAGAAARRDDGADIIVMILIRRGTPLDSVAEVLTLCVFDSATSTL